MILAASRDTYPREFAAILRAEQGVIEEILLLPGTISGDVHAIFQLHMLPIDLSVVGTIHSHPSGTYSPSDADRQLFSHFGRIHIITGYPYALDTWRAYDHYGEPFRLEVLP
ncbi:MAG: Mov34/MPN/PAD-1 family protein [Euryarchaeota archaeon]|nr:Mov34/MPN/PAD-1 family protein [Euryarchaeota archaeon]